VAFQVQDVEAGASAMQQAGAKLLSHPALMPWGDRNARVETPAGMQVTLYQVTTYTIIATQSQGSINYQVLHASL
jgi:hypothetical protein